MVNTYREFSIGLCLAVFLHIVIAIFLLFNLQLQQKNPIGDKTIITRFYVYDYSNKNTIHSNPISQSSLERQASQQKILTNTHFNNQQFLRKNLSGSAKVTSTNTSQSGKQNNNKFVHIYKKPTLSTKQNNQPSNARKNLPPSLQSQSNANGNNNKLLELLHNAIAKTQYYPQTALMLGQTGKVTLQFNMATDGTITNLQVIQTSHFPLLDHAAIDAVNRISPFSIASSYLAHNKTFTIVLVFDSSSP